MGVKGLWQLLEPVGRPVTLDSLEGKVLSVDASILLNQAVKGMRDKTGNPLPNAHLVVLFNRLCKLLFYRIKPIFIFDGGVPILKKKTLAVRRERKFKARHGSNKATEKLVKNYLKGKALETVTGRKSMKTIFRNNGLGDPDIFKLPPISRSQETPQESSSSEAEDDEGVQQFYSQQDFEKKFQDPSSINVDSQDFRSLPEEIQHELIKDVMEEKKWTTIQSMPQDAFGFSDYQLQNVLQRGKLYQRLDELRKEMNNRNNGEVSGLSSQDALGADSSVLSQRIISQDSGHYVLIKTSKENSNENQDAPMFDSLNEGGFFHEGQVAPPQQTKTKIPPCVPSFEMDLNCEAASSDSELEVSLLDVPEIVVLDFDETIEKKEEKKFDIKEEKDATGEDGSGGVMGEDSLQDQSVDVLDNNSKETVQVKGNKVDRNSEDNISVDDDEDNKIIEETQFELKLNKDENEESESIEAQIERHRNKIELLLSKRQSANFLSRRKEVCEKTVEGYESPPIASSAGKDNAEVFSNKALPADDGTIEFRLHLETSSDEEEDEEEDEIPSRDHKVIDDKDRMEEVEDIEETQHDDQENPTVREHLEEDSSDITDKKEEVQVLVHQDNPEEELHERAREEEDGMEIEEISHEKEISVLDEKPIEDETRPSPVPAPSEFAETSKEDLEVMQVNLDVEQQSLQTERARQERMAATVSSEMLTECQELLRLFGVPYLVSPMEAEAQCAFLDFTQQTSGSITDDSDVFLFGGTRVYKNIFNQNKHAELYTIDAITGHLALDRSKMINLAFITGSDYTEGIQGLGAVGAMEVLHEFSSEGFEALIKFKKWHEKTKDNKNSIRETNVKQKLRKLSLPAGFPSQEVFDSYINPVIDESREPFEWGKPDLHGLRLFAKEKLGWPAAKTDETLLPVLKQLNKQENQMRMEDFFQIKFHEPKKKPSRRVRRVINRFHNPLSSSESSSEDEGKTSCGSQTSNTKGRGKETGSRINMAASRVTRGRGRGQSRGRRSTRKAVSTKKFNDDGSGGRDVNDRSNTSNDHVKSGTTIKDSDGGEEGHGSTLVHRKPKKEGRKIGKRKMVGKGKISNQKLQEKGNGSKVTEKDNCNVRDLEEDYDMLKSSLNTQGDHDDKNNERNNLFNNESNLSLLQRNNIKNERYKIPKKTSTTIKEKPGSSGLGNENNESSTSSDSDSEEVRTKWPISRNLTQTIKNGGRGVGRKRTRGRGRGRGATVKRSKIEKMS